MDSSCTWIHLDLETACLGFVVAGTQTVLGDDELVFLFLLPEARVTDLLDTEATSRVFRRRRQSACSVRVVVAHLDRGDTSPGPVDLILSGPS